MATFMRYHETPRIMSVHQVCSRDVNKTLKSDGTNKCGKSKYVEYKELMREKKRKGEGKREETEKRWRETASGRKTDKDQTKRRIERKNTCKWREELSLIHI